MKILATADLHGSQYRLNILLKNIERFSPDLVIICGDITQFGPGELAKNLLDQITIETFAVTGNIDSKDVAHGIDDSNATRIELKKIVKKGIPFVGISGVKPDEFNLLEEKKLVDNKTILVSHVPPYGFQDKVFIGLHGGSKDLRNIIDKYKPQLVLCGHIHEDPGFTKYKNTVIVNCSMGKRGEGAIIDLNKKMSVKMIE
jgi:Icc-related predicted phosphoesterase